MEEWKVSTLAIGCEVSNLGNVRKEGSTELKKVKVDTFGYMRMSGCLGRPMPVHRVVATAFLPNPQGLPVVNHKDFNKANNKVENLEWMSHRDNSRHSGATRRKVILVLDGDKVVGRHLGFEALAKFYDFPLPSVGAYLYKKRLFRGKLRFVQEVKMAGPIYDTTVEGWRQIPGFNYDASIDGRVRNRSDGRVLRPSLIGAYLHLTLPKDGARETRKVHRLVEKAWLDFQPGQMVNHKDGNKTTIDWTTWSG